MEEKRGRGKPSSYPAISLSLCLKKAKAMLEGMARSDKYLPAEDFANLAGYSGFARNSAPKGFLAALSHFGLVEREPRTKAIRFSQGLRSLAWEERSQKAVVVGEALIRPQKYQLLLKSFEGAAPTREECERLLREDGLTERPAKMLAGFFIADLALAESLGVNWEDPLSAKTPQKSRPAGGRRAGDSWREQISLPSGAKMEMSFDNAPKKEDWDFVSEFATLKSSTAKKQ